jgi:sulfatase maturation enzyme AslB (radical SAM superfamily)
MSDTYCPFPWLHFSAHTDGTMRICCNTITNDGGRIYKDDGSKWMLSQIENPLDYYNSQQLKQIRLDMIQGKRPDICRGCFMVEDAGGPSVRTTVNKTYPLEQVIDNTDKDTGSLNALDIKSLDFSWGNKCNLKCKMCHPNASDQLIDEFKTLNIIKDTSQYININLEWGFEKLKLVFEKIIDNVEEILVTGGEPMVNNEFYQFCLFLIERDVAKNITLKFHTNLTITPSKFFNIWKHFKCIRPNISIDAVGPLYEYVRYPGKWDIVSSNIDELISYAQDIDIYIDVHTVFSSFNAHGIPDLIEYFSRYGDNKFISAFPYTIWVDNPSYASSQVLPKHVKNDIVENCMLSILKYKDTFHDHWSKEKTKLLESNLNLMTKQDLNSENFYKFVTNQDNLRKIKYDTTIPWMKT